MGAGWTWIVPGEPAGKDGGRSMLKNIVIDWLSPRYWWSSSSTVFRWVTPRLAMSKTRRTVSSPASPGAVGTTSLLSGTLVFSSLFWASSRRVPIMSSRSFAREGRARIENTSSIGRSASLGKGRSNKKRMHRLPGHVQTACNRSFGDRRLDGALAPPHSGGSIGRRHPALRRGHRGML